MALHIEKLQKLFDIHEELKNSEEAPENWLLKDTIEWPCDSIEDDGELEEHYGFSYYWLKTLAN